MNMKTMVTVIILKLKNIQSSLIAVNLNMNEATFLVESHFWCKRGGLTREALLCGQIFI